MAQEADQECLQLLAIRSTSSGTGNSRFKCIYFSNQHQTAVLSFWVLISGVQYLMIRSSFGVLCVAKPFQNVSSSYILAGRPVITKPIWQSLVTRMAILLSSFGWVCEAYPCDRVLPMQSVPSEN